LLVGCAACRWLLLKPLLPLSRAAFFSTVGSFGFWWVWRPPAARAYFLIFLFLFVFDSY